MTEENKNVEATNTEVVVTEEAATKEDGNLKILNRNEIAPTHQSYISAILEETKQGFLEANAGMDFDFVHMGEWLSRDSKGNFIEKEDESVNYGDSIDVVVGHGEKRYSLWGFDDSPEEGQLIVAEATEQEGRDALESFLETSPDAAERYSYDDIKLRYMAMVVPVSSLGDGEFPQIYNLSLSPSDTIIFGRWAMGVFQGKGLAKEVGIPRGTGINRVVTRLKTVERTNRNNKAQKWIGVDFEPVGMFNPSDYGIQE